MEDGKAVEAMVRNILKTKAELQQTEAADADFKKSVLATLLEPTDKPIGSTEIIQRIESLLTNNASLLALGESADAYLQLLRSR